MSGGRIPVFTAGILAAGMMLTTTPIVAQQADIGVDESRVIIPRAKILRVPGSDAQTDNQDQSDANAAEANADAEASTLETRPLEPLTGSSSGGGVVPLDARIAATDPNAVVAEPLPLPLEQTDQPRVRIISPTTSPDGDTNERNTQTEEETAAVSEDDGRPKWHRKRTRRFKQAPQGTEILDTSRPTYAVPITPIETGLKTGARLRQLDKMTGQTVTYDLVKGESRRVDRLLISLEACRSPENNASHGAMAFLKIWDTRRIGGDPDFTGWMFAESPALSALDHPRYDLWVISCTTSEAEVSTVNE